MTRGGGPISQGRQIPEAPNSTKQFNCKLTARHPHDENLEGEENLDEQGLVRNLLVAEHSLPSLASILINIESLQLLCFWKVVH
jgi:hypothetical protein